MLKSKLNNIYNFLKEYNWLIISAIAITIIAKIYLNYHIIDMKTLTEFINEQLAEVVETPAAEITEGKIESEQDFRDYAENKFKEAFGDDLDEDKMKKTIDGILDDNKDAVEAGEWDKLIGVLNKSF